MKLAALILLAALVAAAAALNTSRPFDDKEILWTKCINVSSSNTACVSLFAVPENVTFGFEFSLDNIVVDFPLVAGNETCLDEADLLKVRLSVPARALQPAYDAAAPVTLLPQLLELVPALAPYKKIIDDIIKGDIFGVCLHLQNFAYNNVTRIVSGCLYNHDDDLGCFQVKV